MMTLNEIREDLKDIRYYYNHRNVFDGGVGNIGMCKVLDKVQWYNNAIHYASPMLYDLYISLYVKSSTQDALADELGYSRVHVQRLNKKLLLYFQSYFEKEEASQ